MIGEARGCWCPGREVDQAIATKTLFGRYRNYCTKKILSPSFPGYELLAPNPPTIRRC